MIPARPTPTPQRRALLVEDEAMIALMLEDDLRDAGVEEVALAHTLRAGLDLARGGAFDLALLDVNLNGERSDSIADALEAREVPFAFSTGYGPRGLTARFRDRPCLTKPHGARELRRVVEGLLAPS